MATFNDMPEFHSVKVFITKNTPPCRYCFINTGNVGINFPRSFTASTGASGFTCGYLSSAFAGGQAHV